MIQDEKKYTPALKFEGLNSLYAELLPLIPSYRRVLKQLIRQADLQPDQKALDVGCGPGFLLRLIKTRYPSTKACGVDIDDDMLEMARKKSREAKLAIPYLQSSADSLPFPDASFDHVFASLLFHHLPLADKQNTILELYRVLKDGGQVHILDFGRPKNSFAKIGFVALQVFDGIANVRPHGKDMFENLLCLSPFPQVRLTNQFNTPLGTLYTYQLIK